MPNRLAQETSPYLLQHANNPVDWYPWGPEALARAKKEMRPIFLSIGYSACHWCHVMEHESFENPDIAQRLNQHFVNIKVDREERPDLDQIYMQAVQLITGRGGWPMSVFLTPDLQPFYGGTYWPPTSRHGMPGFDRVLEAVLDAWQNRRDQAVEQAREITKHLDQMSDLGAPRPDRAPAVPLSAELIQRAAAGLERSYDHRHGGFGGAPKFPHPMDLRVLLRHHRRHPSPELLLMVTHTLDRMAAGGIYDHLGGGFHRYSVDERWLVPHFEKMLYDNALLTSCYVEAYQVTGQADYARVVRETCDYLLRDMTSPEGGFFSTQDADSEGEEGKFYVWSADDLEKILGPERARTFSYVYDVTDGGNFEGHNILNRAKTIPQCAQLLKRDLAELEQELADSRAQLLAVRAKRAWPHLDDKILVAWNGLMIDALASAAAVLPEPRYLAAAQKAAGFLLAHLRRDDGRLWHTYRAGQARLEAYLDDYAAFVQALLTLYETDFDERWLDAALALAEQMLADFADPAGGGLFFTAAHHEQLISRPKDAIDSSVPSGNALAATALLRLAKFTGRDNLRSAGVAILEAFAPLMQSSPLAAGQLLLALDFHVGPTPELVLVADTTDPQVAALLQDLRRRYLPNRLLACRAPIPNTAHRSPALEPRFDGRLPSPSAASKSAIASSDATLFICENFTCQAPIHGADAIRQALDRLTATP